MLYPVEVVPWWMFCSVLFGFCGDGRTRRVWGWCGGWDCFCFLFRLMYIQGANRNGTMKPSFKPPTRIGRTNERREQPCRPESFLSLFLIPMVGEDAAFDELFKLFLRFHIPIANYNRLVIVRWQFERCRLLLCMYVCPYLIEVWHKEKCSWFQKCYLNKVFYKWMKFEWCIFMSLWDEQDELVASTIELCICFPLKLTIWEITSSYTNIFENEKNKRDQ